MRLKPLLFAATALIASGCVGMDLASYDDDELARLLDEPPSSFLDDPGRPDGDDRVPDDTETALDPDPADPDQSTVVETNEVPEFEPPPADAPEPPEVKAVLRISEVTDTNTESVADADSSTDRDRPSDLDLLDRTLLDEEEGEDRPDRPRGVVVASVGDEEIRLPELTRAIRRRIDRLPDDQRPNRRAVIAMVRAEMEARILASLVDQQARRTIPEEDERLEVREEIARDWSESELPNILRRQGLPDAPALDAFLAEDGRSLDDLRSVFESRALARELIRREGLDVEDVDAYFETLRDRFPIASDLMPDGRRSDG